MALASGIRFGHYLIVGPLGAGGMGEVYRARDTTLDRDVALKILPESFAADPDRLMRFEREAKTLASLNHPHIAHIYGIDESSGVRALVMELVEGEDLSERLARGPIPLDEALPIARQVADALEAAHEAGTVHRDLKPANVKVRPDGTVKVLDFGLAKGVAEPGAHNQNSPTFTSPAVTRMGIILGTAAYMAPEQARGKAVDKRADIWAFGCLLYEMLGGRRAFEAENITDTLAAIVTRDPEWAALPPGVPDGIHQLLRRCLARDPRVRLRDIGEARVLLEGAVPSADAIRPGARSATGRRSRTTIAWLMLVAAAASTGYLVAGSRTRASSRVLRTTFKQITEQPGLERQPTISPDGKTVVFVSEARGKSDLYSLRVGGRNAVLLTGDSQKGDYAPSFSPDGNRIAFRSERDGGGIFVMEATGESVRRVANFGFDPHWSPDGSQLAVAEEGVFDPMTRSSDSRIWSVPVAGGEKRLLADADGVGPRWSPGGRRIVYWGRRRGRRSERDILTVAADGSQARTPVSVTDDAAVDSSPTWSPDGQFIYFASSRGGTMNLWRIAIDEASGRTRGAPEPVTTPTGWSGSFEFAADGKTLVFSDLDERSIIFAAGFDPAHGRLTSTPRQVLQGRAINSVDVTRDGRAIVFSQRGQTWEALGTISVDGTGWSRITDDAFFHRLPSWMPDGARLLFYMNRSGVGLWTARRDGSELVEMPLPDGLSTGVYPVSSPDGRLVVAAFAQATAVIDVSASPPTVLQRFAADADFRPYSWSRDGRWIAGTARYGTRDDLVLLDLRDRSRRVLTREGSSPAWLPDGRRFLYSTLTHLSLLDVQTGSVQQLLPLARTFDAWGRTIALSADGTTLVYLQSQAEGDVWMMTLSD